MPQNSVQRRNFTCSGIPGYDRQKSWRYRLSPSKEEGKGGVLTVMTGGKHLRWRLPESLSTDSETKIQRLPDVPEGAQKSKGEEGEVDGVLQVHKSSHGELHATMQDGKSNSTIRLTERDGAWHIKPVEPKKSKANHALDFLSTITAKDKQEQKEARHTPAPTELPPLPPQTNGFDTLAYPINSQNPWLGLAAGAGIGALAGVGHTALSRLSNHLKGKPQDDSGYLQSGLLGAGIGAGTAGLWRVGDALLGGPRPPGSIPIGQREPTNPLVDKGVALADAHIPKIAMKKQAVDIDYRDVLANIRTDPELADFERRNLMEQTHEASRKKIPVEPQMLIAAGFSALASYILARLMNAGTFGRAAASAIGGLVGGYAFAPEQGMTRGGGEYTLE